MIESNETEETTSDEAVEDAAPVEQPAAEAAPEAEAPATPAEPAEQLSPKEVRRRKRSQAGGAKPERTAEERAAERAEHRSKQAARRRAYRTRAKERSKARRAEAGPAPVPAPAEETSGTRKVRQGVVVSDKADKTITVRIDVARRHRRYHKVVRTSSTLHAHDERNEANIGDMVRVIESRPLSRTKRWRLVDILERAR
jgi:small subunit ribosomal protein S17